MTKFFTKFCLFVISISLSVISFDSKAELYSNATATHSGNSFPVVYTFQQSSDLDGFTIINANNDSYTWGFTTVAPISKTAAWCPAKRDMNDWLITPAVQLKAGVAYKVSVTLHGQNTSDRIIARLWMGVSPSVGGMTTKIAQAVNQKIAPATPSVIGDYFVPTVDGAYYLGIHCGNEEDESPLYVTRIEIEAPVNQSIPASPTGFVAIPDPDGLNKVTLKATAPKLTQFGDELDSLDKMVFYCGERKIGEIANPVPGQEYTLVDSNAISGNNTYTCVAYNEAGESEAVSAEVYVGVAVPGIAEGLTVKEIGNTGKLMLSWNPITVDAKGNPMNSANVKYNVTVYAGGQVVKTYNNIAESSVETASVLAEGGTFARFKVAGVTVAGEGKSVESETIPVGVPLKGMTESFANKIYNNPFFGALIDGDSDDTEWRVFNDTDYTFKSQDHDNGYLLAWGRSKGDELQCTFLKIDLADIKEPLLSFYTYTIVSSGGPSTNIITVKVRECGGEFETLFSKSNKEIGSEMGWHKVNVDLSKFAGKTIEMRISARVEMYGNTVFDNFKIGQTIHKDLVVNDIVAPAEINPGDKYNVKVTFINEGIEKISGHKVTLFADDTKVDAVDCADIEASGWQTYTFSRQSHVLDEAPVDYYAVVEYEGDQNPENNISNQISVKLNVSELPTVTDLSGKVVDKKVELSWSAPNINQGFGEQKTEDFESAESFATAFKWWTFIDRDGKIVGGLMNEDVPNIPSGKGTATFFIWDNDVLSNSLSKAYSGQHFLASLFNDDDSAVDDWAISPVLSGKKQIITFMARSYTSEYPESVEVLYSTGSTDPSMFISLKKFVKLSDSWTKYSVELPEGAQRFALRSIAAGGFILMIDDVCYEQGANYADYHVTGYDIYRDRVKLNETPLTDTKYVDVTGTGTGTYTYAVQTHYSEGESKSSNECVVEIDLSGVEDIETAKAIITVSDGVVTITGKDNMTLNLSDVSGILYYSGKIESGFNICLPKGYYIVSIDGKSAKIAIR